MSSLLHVRLSRFCNLTPCCFGFRDRFDFLLDPASPQVARSPHTNAETSSPQNVLPVLLFQGQHAPLASQLPKQRATWPDKGQVRPAFSVTLNGGYPPAISGEGRPEMSGPNPVKAAHIKHRVQQVFLAHF